jgi:hypothetical protein
MKKKSYLCAVCRQTFVGGISRFLVFSQSIYMYIRVQMKAREGYVCNGMYSMYGDKRKKKKLVDSGTVSASSCQVPNPGRGRDRAQHAVWNDIGRSHVRATPSESPSPFTDSDHTMHTNHSYKCERRRSEMHCTHCQSRNSVTSFFGVTFNSPTMIVYNALSA